MLAVLKNGGKQYLVKSGDIVKLEKIEAKVGESITFREVMFLGDDKKKPVVGDDFVKGVEIKAEVVSQQKDKKILVFKKKRRKDYKRLKGHRQHSTTIKINSIEAK